MKSLIKKIAVFVFALVVMGSTASSVLAGDHTGPERPGWPPPDPGPWTHPGQDNG